MQIEEEKEDHPIIKQTRFLLPKKRSYLFDVNQDISIYKLKKMISVAANLGKNIRLFHDNIEYTDKDSSTLEELFPQLQLIEFKIEPQSQQIEELDDLINLRLKSFCEGHKGKYPNFYCHTCAKSICTECLRDIKHKGHDIKEKYDYLQESKGLIENLFYDLKDLLDKGEGIPDNLINNLKTKISIQFFPKLVEIVKQIEKNMLDLILFFLEKDKNNFKIVQSNLTLLKSSCAEGLDKLKENIEIEDLMVDENIFLTFDSKYKGINNEKDKIVKDINTYKAFSDNLNLIENIVDKTYNEIYEFLTKYLEITKFADIRTKLTNNIFTEINKKEILEKILNDIKKKETKPTFIEFLKHIRKSTEKNKEQKEQEDIEMKDAAASTASKSDIKKEKEKEEEKEKEKGSKDIKEEKDKEINIKIEKEEQKEKNEKKEKKEIENPKEQKEEKETKEKSGIKNKENKEYKKKELKTMSQNNPDNKKQLDLKESQPHGRKLRSNSIKAVPRTAKDKQDDIEEENAAPSPIFCRVMSIIPGTEQILTYNSNKNTNTMKKVEFPALLGIKHFLKDCSWVNYKNKLYILGGELKSKKSKIFIEYNSLKNSFKRLPDSKHAHKGHCLIIHENSIYCIGGGQDECEKYDFNDNTWNALPKMAFAQENPVLYIHNNILYSLFGTNENGKYIDNIQKLNLNLKTGKAKWTNVNYNRNDCDLKIFGCGIIKMDENKVYLLGGKLENEVSKSMIEFDFYAMKANKNENTLGQNAYFKESMMLRIGEEQFGNYSIDKDNSSSLITVTIDKRYIDKGDKI